MRQPRGITLMTVLIFLARPVATFLATAFTSFDAREKLMLGWAGLRGATPIWLATCVPAFPPCSAGDAGWSVIPVNS